ncbi:hypothetical protein CLV86_2775 [Lacinutrix venerupis]|uniref:Chloroplast import component protein (Tic20) n=1 Tax=Lacinutrix venerupis TaxID=1486034 RepID=A0AAC9LKD0_9FLAO|nr:hypothetical protein [Lacinutrix venerupis]APY00015.1 hypothetical protein BWR22_06730 [Lacinutrix venerupis]RLJ60925.1 hypothetical protein CLV86_2775 [Lacinutrix venerupis]
MNQEIIEEGKMMSVVAYLTIIGSIIALITNNDKKNPFVAFHVRQGLGLCLTYLLLGYFIGSFNSWAISIGFWIGFGVLFFYGLIGAITGKMNEVPLLGPLYQKIFSNIGK